MIAAVPLSPNPGGLLDPKDTVGRRREVARSFEIVERQGLILSAERRIGKTHIVRKMQAEEPDHLVMIYRDLERIHSPIELVREVYASIEPQLKTGRKLKTKAISAWTTLAPTCVGELELPRAADNWKGLLTSAFDDVLSVVEPPRKVVFIWDEFPLMIDNIRKKIEPRVAIELLDLLRTERQSRSANLRFVFTRSVGLHLVLRELRNQKNANAPVNDMFLETVPQMSREDALELTYRLLASLWPAPVDMDRIADRVSELVGGFPYYIQHTIDRLSQLTVRATVAEVDSAVDTLLCADGDPAQFGHHAHRIDLYYSTDEAPVARAILDAIAREDRPLTTDDLAAAVRVPSSVDKFELIRTVLQLLREDHYLTREKTNAGSVFSFRWPLLKRWWREART